MSGTYPTTPAPIAVDYTMLTPTFVSETHSGRVQSRDRGAAGYWQMEFHYPALTRAQFGPLWAFLIQQKGRAETFQVVNPALTWLGSNQSALITVGTQSAGDTSFVAGAFAVSGDQINAGDIVSIGSAPKKVYTSLEDVQAGGGNQTVNIYPALVRDTSAVELVNYKPANVPFTVSLMSDFTTVSVDHCLIHGGLTVAMRERI